MMMPVPMPRELLDHVAAGALAERGEHGTATTPTAMPVKVRPCRLRSDSALDEVTGSSLLTLAREREGSERREQGLVEASHRA
jgi:hypothetical protein